MSVPSIPAAPGHQPPHCASLTIAVASVDVKVRELSVPGALEVTPVQHGDDRGCVPRVVPRGPLHAGHGPRAPTSPRPTARSPRWAPLRGIHFAQLPPSQAKFVTCCQRCGARRGRRPARGIADFGAWDSVLIDDTDRRAVYLPEGLGHAFLALDDAARSSPTCARPPTRRGASTACTRSTRRSASTGPPRTGAGVRWSCCSRRRMPLRRRWRRCASRVCWRRSRTACAYAQGSVLEGGAGLERFPPRRGGGGTTRRCRRGPGSKAPAARSRARSLILVMSTE